jgi:hypothetical protein
VPLKEEQSLNREAKGLRRIKNKNSSWKKTKTKTITEIETQWINSAAERRG